jgi:hypothetical protein
MGWRYEWVAELDADVLAVLEDEMRRAHADEGEA